MVTSFLSLEKIVFLNDKVVHELYAQVRLGLDVVFHIDQPIYSNVDGEAVRCKLGRDFFIYLNKHVMAALDDGLL